MIGKYTSQWVRRLLAATIVLAVAIHGSGVLSASAQSVASVGPSPTHNCCDDCAPTNKAASACQLSCATMQAVLPISSIDLLPVPFAIEYPRFVLGSDDYWFAPNPFPAKYQP